jgi:FtsZ-interacting cell division protein YlmF
MKEKTRRILGFLGLVEDEYGDYSPQTSARPFSDSGEEQGFNAPAATSRPFPTTPSGAPTPAGVGQFRPRPPVSQTSSVSVLDSSGQGPRVRAVTSPNAARGVSSFSQERDVAFFTPRSFNESRRVTDLLRSNRAVVMNLMFVDAELRRRLIDFTAGTVWALNAKIEPLDPAVYLVSPSGVHLNPDTKERLRANNYQDPNA